MSRDPASLQRTEWVERDVEEFLGLPLIREFVFRSPQFLDKGIQKEVADFLIAHGEIAILVSQKCQENPSTRTGAKAELWARKAAKGAISQLRGALRQRNSTTIWCDHIRRGRVQFLNGLPTIDHAIVVVEVFGRVNLEPDADHLPLDFQGTPITYLSLNDFLNLAMNLRTSSELLAYFDVRSCLPSSDCRVIGDERSLFECYLLEGPSLGGAKSRADAAALVKGKQARLREMIEAKSELDFYNSLLEHVADELATRLPEFEADVPASMLAHFDAPGSRNGYLKMQNILAGLRLGERAQLGRAFYDVIANLRNDSNGFTFRSARIESKPDLVFVFASSKGVDRAEALARLKVLVTGGMGFYRQNCLVVLDRDSVGYELALGLLDSEPTAVEQKIGQEVFGHLKTTKLPIQLGA